MLPDLEALVGQACESTGLSDFGPDGWQEGLDHLVAAAGTDLASEADTDRRLLATIQGRLTNRLLIEEWYTRQRAEPPPVRGLVVIHGLPRTATTALQYLLARDPRFRYQRRWEISRPVPPRGSTCDADDERRIAALDRADTAGAVSVQHISELDGPVDDGSLLGLDFHNQELGLPLFTYTRWWRGSSLRSTYAYHERVLRLLHTGRPPYSWVVKAPYHNFHLDDLAAHYPEARFVMAHRDPAVALPSACSTVLAAQRNALPHQPPDPGELGSFLLEHLAEGARRAMAARDVIGERRFIDIAQREIEADAVETAERIYDFLELPLDAPTRASMSEWADANRRGSRGVHSYAAEDYGLTAPRIREAFGDYIERFQVAPEVG
jgi:hypothetical protein